jgi:uncharacterized protein (PEP-CTERM system associated)
MRLLWLSTVAAATLATPVALAQQPGWSPDAPAAQFQPPGEPAPGEAIPTAPETRREQLEAAQERQGSVGRGFALVPTVGLDLAVTDNVALSEHDRKSDLLVRALLRLDALLNRGRAYGQLFVEGLYDQYARSNDFNGASLEANGEGSYSLVPDILSLEAHADVTSGRTNNFGTPAIDRAGVNNRVQLAVWDVGPRLTSKLGDFADLEAVARYSQVHYWGADSSRLTAPLPPDDGIVQVLGRLDTGKRITAYELLTTVQFAKDDHGYQTVNAVQSVYVNIDPVIRLFGRAGYEHVEQEDIADIEAPLLSAGVEWTPNANSRISLEGGQRFHRAAWAAHAEATLSNHVFLVGDYSEAVQPDQVFVVGSFQQFVEENLNLPLPIAPQRFQLQDNIYSQPSFNKVGELRILLTNPRTSLELSGRYSDREFLGFETNDRTVLAQAVLKHALRPDLDGVIHASYARTYESPVYGPSRNYAVNAQLAYRANSTTDFTATYAYANGKQLFTAGETISDNSFLIAIRKRF